MFIHIDVNHGWDGGLEPPRFGWNKLTITSMATQSVCLIWEFAHNIASVI